MSVVRSNFNSPELDALVSIRIAVLSILPRAWSLPNPSEVVIVNQTCFVGRTTLSTWVFEAFIPRKRILRA